MFVKARFWGGDEELLFQKLLANVNRQTHVLLVLRR